MTTLTKAKAFKGILQYKSTDNFTKEAGYVYFIREFNENSEETVNAEIYFGNRKYGDVNVSQLSEIENILERIDELAQEIEGKQNIIDDIDNIREGASLGSTALQSYTEQYKGTVTGVKINGTTKNPTSGVVDLGYANKKLITSSSSSMTVFPNFYYRNTSTSLSSLAIILGRADDGNIINEYFVEFTTSSSGTTVSLPSKVKWSNGETPTFEAGCTYQVSIVNNLGTVQKFK